MLRDPATPRRGSRRSPGRPLRFLAVGSLLALAAAGCGNPLPKPQPGDSPAAYSGLEVDEDRVEYAIGKVSDIVSEEMEATEVPGVAVAVVHNGEVAFSEGFGVRSIATGEEVDADTVFPLASISAPVSATVAAAAMAAMAEGGVKSEREGDAADEVDWSTPVRGHLPWFELSDPRASPMVTVGDLFAHRSGLPKDAGDDLEAIGYDRPAPLHGLRHLPLDEFRTSYAHSDFGLTAGAEAVAVAAGMRWNDLARERVFSPLGMGDTSFSHDDFLERSNRAAGHVRAKSQGVSSEDSGSGESGGRSGSEGEGDSSVDAETSGPWTLADPATDPDTYAPAGGLSSSASDMARWMSMVLADGQNPASGEVVPGEALREALTPQVTSSPPGASADRTESSGFGFTITDSSSGRVQWSDPTSFQPGAGTAMLMMPSLDLGIITLTNATPVGAAETINARFADLAQYGDPAQEWGSHYGAEFGPMLAPAGDLASEPRPTNPEPSRPTEELVGTYRSEYFGPLEVSRSGEELALNMGRGLEPWPLEHWDGDTFAVSPSGGNWPAGTRGSLLFDDDEMTINLLDANGLGTFVRAESSDETEG